MNELRVELFLTVVALLLATGAGLRWKHALDFANTVDPTPSVILRKPSKQLVNADSVADAASTITANDPFRLSNSSASVPYSPDQDGVGPGAATRQVVARIRPPLVVKGIIGGPPWQAIIDGIPGQPPGSVVLAGMAFDKLVVRTITRDTVVVQGPDTTWKLTLGGTRP